MSAVELIRLGSAEKCICLFYDPVSVECQEVGYALSRTSKLGFFPLPSSEAVRLRKWLSFSEQFSALDPYVGDSRIQEAARIQQCVVLWDRDRCASAAVVYLSAWLTTDPTLRTFVRISGAFPDDEMKYRIIYTLQKYVLNPPIKLVLAIGLPLPGYALLETKGRKTGKRRRTPVGDGRIGNQFWLVAEHGMKAGYVRNVERDPHVRLKLREGLKYKWHTGTAHLLSHDDPRERQRWLATQLPSSAGNSRAVGLFGTQLLTVRIDLND